jgi:ubiquinone/menaquinone biosynthesis C-methylase UbiE
MQRHTDETVDTSYEPFSREPEYIELNRLFIRDLTLRPGSTVLDLACGTGTLSGLILAELGGRVRIVGVDLSRRSLLLARADLDAACTGGSMPATTILVEGSADCLPVSSDSVDAVVMGNAIHYFHDPDHLFREIRRVLRPGGLFAFNTSFYAGTFVPGTEKFYEEWLKEAVKYLRGRDGEARRGGGPGIRRTRGQAPPAFSRRWQSPEEYLNALGRHGFGARSVNYRTVEMTQRAFETVGAYEGLAAVLLSGFPAAIASEALTRSVETALASVGLRAVPRHWLEVAVVDDRGNGPARGAEGNGADRSQ